MLTSRLHVSGAMRLRRTSIMEEEISPDPSLNAVPRVRQTIVSAAPLRKCRVFAADDAV
jgi:hypothetical protein